MRRLLIASAGCAAALALTTPHAHADPPSAHGSCAGFGANVATLATTLGPVFGATASGVASSAPRAFPTFVVHPEQASLCVPR